MATVIPSGSGIAAFQFSCTGKPDPIITTLAYGYSDLNSPTEHAQVIYEAWTGVGGPFTASWINTGYRFLGVTTQENGPDGLVTGQKMQAVVGTLSGDPMPPNCAILIKKNTGRGGRKGRGRMFLPPCFFGETGVDLAGVIAPSLVTGLEDRLNLALGLQVADELPPQLLHEDGTAGNDITSFAVSSLIATQRRRLR